MENGAADAATGHSNPVPIEAPAAAAADKGALREPVPGVGDDSEPGGTGRPLLSMPNASMVTAPKAEPDPVETLTPHHLPVQKPAQRSSASRNGRAAGQGVAGFPDAQVVGSAGTFHARRLPRWHPGRERPGRWR